MFEFAWLWALLLLPVPVLVRWLIPKRETKPPSVKVPFYKQAQIVQLTSSAPSKVRLVWAILGWVCIVVATARPLWVEETVNVPISGRDLLLALDISGSMQQTDFTVGRGSRFDSVRKIAGDFVTRRKGDRVGLILFGSQPYLYAPLTFDTDTVVDFLNSSQVGLAGQRTAIGDTIGLAVKILRERPVENRILILLTDGENSAGSIDPLQGMKLAVEHGIRIFVIAIGPDYSLPTTSGSASPGGNLLEHIATQTQGYYFHASNARALQEIYQTIDEFEPIEGEIEKRTSAIELYIWPLALALVFATLFLLHGLLIGLTSPSDTRVQGESHAA